VSESGSGRYAQSACASSLYAADSEPLPDPREAASEALRSVGWLRGPDVTAILTALDDAGLTICWQTP
jgi:hypothetical protein